MAFRIGGGTLPAAFYHDIGPRQWFAFLIDNLP